MGLFKSEDEKRDEVEQFIKDSLIDHKCTEEEKQEILKFGRKQGLTAPEVTAMLRKEQSKLLHGMIEDTMRDGEFSDVEHSVLMRRGRELGLEDDEILFEIEAHIGRKLEQTASLSANKMVEFGRKLRGEPSVPTISKPQAPQLRSYTLAVNGQQMGPFDLTKLQEMAQTGQFTPQTLVWKTGMPNWTPAGQVDELKLFFPPQMPSIPQV